MSDRFGASRMTLLALGGIARGALVFAVMPVTVGTAGYLVPIIVVTSADTLFRASSTAVVVIEVRPEQRGVFSGLLDLARNVGRISGASVMGAGFALGSATDDIATTRPKAVATGSHVTFAVAAVFVRVALAVATRTHGPSHHRCRGASPLARS